MDVVQTGRKTNKKMFCSLWIPLWDKTENRWSQCTSSFLKLAFTDALLLTLPLQEDLYDTSGELKSDSSRPRQVCPSFFFTYYSSCLGRHRVEHWLWWFPGCSILNKFHSLSQSNFQDCKFIEDECCLTSRGVQRLNKNGMWGHIEIHERC